MHSLNTMLQDTIPDMTDAMGQHWKQPEKTDFLIDSTHAVMTRQTFDKLPEYSCSTPTAVYPGKMWKRREPYSGEVKRWLLCWYGESEKGPDYCSTNVREILFL